MRMESSALDSRHPTWSGLAQTPPPSVVENGVETFEPAGSQSPIGSGVALGVAVGGTFGVAAEGPVVGVGAGVGKATEHAPATITVTTSAVISAVGRPNASAAIKGLSWLEGAAPEGPGGCLITPGPQHDQHGSLAHDDLGRPTSVGLVGCHLGGHRLDVPVDAVPGDEDLMVVLQDGHKA
jgi:hypothetical protein